MSSTSPQRRRRPAARTSRPACPTTSTCAHCYRHPDRETGVSCSNCGRPICHECMIPAPVGFRCPECVREQTRGAGPRPRRHAGADALALAERHARLAAADRHQGADRHQRRHLPRSSRARGRPAWSGSATLTPAAAGRPIRRGRPRHEYWRLLTSHVPARGLIHILFNMWALLVVGDFLEAVVGRALPRRLPRRRPRRLRARARAPPRLAPHGRRLGRHLRRLRRPRRVRVPEPGRATASGAPCCATGRLHPGHQPRHHLRRSRASRGRGTSAASSAAPPSCSP